MNREIKTDLENILSLITCAEDYGFSHNMLYSDWADQIGELTEKEIEWYARSVEAEDGYYEEDYESIKERLETFKEKYL